MIRALRGMIQLGVAPALSQSVAVDATPVDELSRVAVSLLASPERRKVVNGKVLNLIAR